MSERDDQAILLNASREFERERERDDQAIFLGHLK